MTHDEVSTIDLADGRQLAYCEYGDPAGYPVLNCHGGLVCRLDVAPADAAAREAGVRLISPDRPGVGRSTRQEGRTVGGWAEDARALADHLALDRFAVFGWSMGGPYAAACGALLPDRVQAALIVGGGVPLDWPVAGGNFDNRSDAAIMKMARHRPRAARTTILATRGMAEHAQAVWRRTTLHALAPSDVAAIERDGVEGFRRAMVEGLADPDGVVDEYLAYDAPWGFSFEDVAVPVRLWQGAEDTLVPASWSEEAARRFPRATLRMVPGAGHFVARDHWADILADLLEAARS